MPNKQKHLSSSSVRLGKGFEQIQVPITFSIELSSIFHHNKNHKLFAQTFSAFMFFYYLKTFPTFFFTFFPFQHGKNCKEQNKSFT